MNDRLVPKPAIQTDPPLQAVVQRVKTSRGSPSRHVSRALTQPVDDFTFSLISFDNSEN
jgi:hypothetical protein